MEVIDPGCEPPAVTAQSGAACTSVCETVAPVAVEGDPEHPVNRGRLCPKGLSEHLAIHSPDRLRQPIVDGYAAIRRVMSLLLRSVQRSCCVPVDDGMAQPIR